MGGTGVRWAGSIGHRSPGGGTFEGRGQDGPFEGDPAVMFSFLLFHFSFCFLFELFSSFFGFLSNMFDCWHKCQSLTLDVSFRSRCSMGMWCPHDIGRDSRDWVGGGDSSPAHTEPPQIALLLLFQSTSRSEVFDHVEYV